MGCATRGAAEIWFALYTPADERRLRARLGAFEVATIKAGHGWAGYDLTDEFAVWLAGYPYRNRFFQSPQFLTNDALKAFDRYLAERLRATLTASEVDEHTVVAVWGVASLFGLTRVSRLLEATSEQICGRLLIAQGILARSDGDVGPQPDQFDNGHLRAHLLGCAAAGGGCDGSALRDSIVPE